MKLHRIAAATAALTLGLAAAAAHAQATAGSTAREAQVLQRDVHQEQRIESGLQQGRISTREGALLQRDAARVDRLESQALKDGHLSAAEAARINRAENRTSADIATARRNGVGGNPLSASSQRLQAATQRDIDQQQRIVNGVHDGQLGQRQVSRLEAGQAHDDARQYRAGRDGHVGWREAAGVNRAQNRQSARIHAARQG